MNLRKSRWMIAAVVVALSTAPAGAATAVYTPAGMKVGLEFRTPVDTATSAKGNKVNFRVAADVVLDRYIVIKKGTTCTGTVTTASPPGRFGKGARVVIGFLSVNAVDHKPVALNDVTITPDNTSKKKAAGAAAVGVIVTDSAWGLLGGALVKGNNVQVPVGAVVGGTTRDGVTIKVP